MTTDSPPRPPRRAPLVRTLVVLAAAASLLGCDGRAPDRITGVSPAPQTSLASPAEFTASTPVPYTCLGFDCRNMKPLLTCSPTTCDRYFSHWVPAIQIPPGRYLIRVRIEGYTYLYRKELYGCSALTTRDGPEGRIVDGEFVYTGSLHGTFRFASGGVQWLTFSPVGDSDFASEAVFQPANESGGTLLLHRYGNSETGQGCVFSGATDQRLIVTATPVDPPLPQPKLALTCTGDLGANRVTRGQQIECTAAKNPASAPGELKITGWTFNGRARTDGVPTSAEWTGIMVRGGKVEVRGTIDGAALRDEQTIRVERRGWSVMQFPVPRHVVGLDPASMDDYPPAGLAYGRFKPEWPDFTTLDAQGIVAGPNAGSWFLPEPVQLPQPLAFVHPALYLPALPAPLGPGSPGYSQWLLWYDDQNGRPAGTCRPQAVTQFRGNVEIHEGATGATNSHWEVGNRTLSSTRLHERFEELTSDQGADDLRFRTNDLWQRWLAGPYRSRQRQFDSSDYPNVFDLGCSLDSNPNDS